ncbi:MAG: ATP-grasp domain-containing protein [Aliidongia sp.]
MRAEAIARHIAEKLGVVGVLAVEMFVTQDDRILVNELAPAGRIIPAIGRSTPATPASSSSWCARSAGCRSARPTTMPMRS